VAAPLLVVGLAVAADTVEPEPVKRGRALFADTGELTYASCAHCHGLAAEGGERKSKVRKQAHTLFGAVLREGWRNRNNYADVGAASQYCAKTFQERRKGLTVSQRKDLIAFLATQVPKDKTKLPKREVKRAKMHKDFTKYEGGDAVKGKGLFERSCVECHNDRDDSISMILKPGKKTKKLIVRKVRGYDAKRRFKPSTMGYFTAASLSDDELRHVLAYLGR